MSDTDTGTEIALLKFQQQQTTQLLAALSTDVREMKEALLLNIASNKSQDARHAEYELHFTRHEALFTELRGFMNKALGVISVLTPLAAWGLNHFVK